MKTSNFNIIVVITVEKIWQAVWIIISLLSLQDTRQHLNDNMALKSSSIDLPIICYYSYAKVTFIWYLISLSLWFIFPYVFDSIFHNSDWKKYITKATSEHTDYLIKYFKGFITTDITLVKYNLRFGSQILIWINIRRNWKALPSRHQSFIVNRFWVRFLILRILLTRFARRKFKMLLQKKKK